MKVTLARWFRSLTAKFILLLLAGGVTAGAIGAWITYRATDTQLEQRLVDRVDTLGHAINHAAMAAPDWAVAQHMVEEITADEPDIRNIIIVGKSPRTILASSRPALKGLPLDVLTDHHLRREIVDALEHGHFGNHFEPDRYLERAGDLVMILPLGPAVAIHNEHGPPDDTRPAGGDIPGQHSLSKEIVAAAGPIATIPQFRGAILISVSQEAVRRGVSVVLWRHLMALAAAITVILIMTWLALEYQVLRPIRSIHAAISRRKAGDTTARATLTQQDEIAAVAQTLNETLDKENRQNQTLSQINDQLAQSVLRAEAANVAKSTFLANMSHELRTPLNAIIGFSEIMKTEEFGPIENSRYLGYCGDIHNAGHHLLNIINDILDLSKIEAEKDELFEEPLEIVDAVDAALSLVRQQAEKNNIRLVIKIDENIPRLNADERKLRQILVNLLTNAVKFTLPGGTVTISVRCDPVSGFVFEIVDSGIGIAPTDIPKAFSPFVQVDSDLTRRYDGTGLGLPLTKALIELHGGSLDLTSEEGIGTIVTVRFPAWRTVAGIV